MKILVLTTRNIYEEGGEKTLMKAKSNFLKSYGIDVYFYSFRRKIPTVELQDLKILIQEKTYSLFYRKRFIEKQLTKLITKYNIDVLVVSGVWLYYIKNVLHKLKQNLGIKISLDFQGAIEEIKEYNLVYNNALLSNLVYKYMKKLEREFIRITDGIEVVSKNCMIYLDQEYEISKLKKDFVIVPCGIEKQFSDIEYLEYRNKWRKKFALTKDTVGIVYVGGIHKWQRINDIFEIVRGLKSMNNVKVFIFTSTRNQSILRKKYREIANFKNLYLEFLPHEILTKALCAFDIGLLFRYSDITNFVAFPNKFSEYINARLLVLLKSKHIGCYPTGKFEALVGLLEKNNDIRRYISCIKDRKSLYYLYREYIKEISYRYTVKRLVNYYYNLCGKDESS